jgi:Fe-S oxidoreductase
MATYKSEFLSHYYEGHRRPISAYAFGLIHYWARLGSMAPWLVNFVTGTPGLRELAKLASGMAFERRIPAFAPRTFTDWFRGRSPKSTDRARGEGRPRVLLWPDTFNNHFHPRTAIDAVHVLERAGCEVVVPARPVCCGRPLYDYGMLEMAKDWLLDVVQALAAEIQDGVPIIGLEPSCVAVFRDEAPNLLPDREDVKRLARQSFTLGEYLDRIGFDAPPLHRAAIVHGHCHQKAVLDMGAEERVLKAMGLDVQVLESGCCGMAGSFGFEREHYDVSMKVGERVLLPAVRQAPTDTLIVADGFSCRTQIAQATGRRAFHLADVLEMAMREGEEGAKGEYPERAYVPDDRAAEAVPATVVAVAGLAAASLVGYFLARRAGRAA